MMSNYADISSAPSTLSHESAYFDAQSQKINQYDVYKARLENYQFQRKTVQQVQRQTHKPNLVKIKLNEVTKEFKETLKSIRQLKQTRNQLKQILDNAPANEWQDICDQISEQKSKLISILSKYESDSVQHQIKNSISKRKNKRANIQKAKGKLRQNRQNEQLEREEKHKKIDLWLTENLRKTSEQRQRIEDANRAEHILAGVTRKQIEAKKYLALFDSLVELRRVKQVQSGRNVAGATEFNQKITDLRRVWLDALHDYESEENELRKFLCVRSDQGSFSEWCKVLFGQNSSNENASRNNLMLKAEHNVRQLIRIR